MLSCSLTSGPGNTLGVASTFSAAADSSLRLITDRDTSFLRRAGSCWSTCASSWASRCVPAGEAVSGTPSGRNTSRPTVNARADIVAASWALAAPLCTRTVERSAPSADSMSRRTGSGIAAPRPRADVMALRRAGDSSPPAGPISGAGAGGKPDC